MKFELEIRKLLHRLSIYLHAHHNNERACTCLHVYVQPFGAKVNYSLLGQQVQVYIQ